MNIKSEWGNNREDEEDRLPTIKRRQVSLRERIQQWKRQRQSIQNDGAIITAGGDQLGHQEDHHEDVKPTEMKLIQLLSDRASSAFSLPVEVATLAAAVVTSSSDADLGDILAKLQQQKVLEVTTLENGKSTVTSIDYDHLEALKEKYASSISFRELSAQQKRLQTLLEQDQQQQQRQQIKAESESIEERPIRSEKASKREDGEGPEEEKSLVECILSLQSAKERENKRISEEIHQLLSKPTAKELSLVEQFRSATGHVQEFCQHGTREDCRRVKLQNATKSASSSSANHQLLLEPCPKLHFCKIIQKHTDESLGDCSFLNTCFHMESCKYVHYKVEVRSKGVGSNSSSKSNPNNSNNGNRNSTTSNKAIANTSATATSEGENGASTSAEASASSVPETAVATVQPQTASAVPLAKTLASATEQPFKRVLFPPQWIKCDLRYFDMSILGKFAIIMADPPWDIHMELPYGTMSDDEMRKLNIPSLQDEGIIFLWVTGRAMELGRECLQLWGYERCDELIWVKTNQLQRIIRTGRTGHWINHGKEHCLVGVKGSPKNLNRGLDCDVIVAEVRATSHKPDEVYGIIERLSPGTRKIELFGRQHNTQPNWVTLGNQLTGLEIVDPALVEQYKRLYPEDARKFNLL